MIESCPIYLILAMSSASSHVALYSSPLLAQLTSLSLLAGSSTGTTSSITAILFSVSALRAVDWLQSLRARQVASLLTSLVLSSMLMALLPMLFLEAVSTLFRSLSLGFRHNANSVAGHVLMHIIGAASWSFTAMGTLSVLVTLAVTGFELGVAVVQLGIVAVLISSYNGRIRS